MKAKNTTKRDCKFLSQIIQELNTTEQEIRIIFLFVFLLHISQIVFAYDAYVNGIYYELDFAEKEAKVISGEGVCYEGDIIIPETIEHESELYNVTSIAGSAFHSCYNLTSIVFGNNITYIGSYAFASCWGLKSLVFPNGVDMIDQKAFYDCISLSTIDISQSVTYIGRGAFEKCRNLTSVYMPDNVRHLDESVFEDCTSLSSIKLSNNITSLKKRVFFGCSSLSTIFLHENIMDIQEDAFGNCPNLNNVYCYNSFVPYTHIRVFHNTDIKNATLYVPEEAIDRYKRTNPWWNFGTIVAIKEQGIDINTIGNDGVYEKSYYKLNGMKANRYTKDVNIINNYNGKILKVIVAP